MDGGGEHIRLGEAGFDWQTLPPGGGGTACSFEGGVISVYTSETGVIDAMGESRPCLLLGKETPIRREKIRSK